MRTRSLRGPRASSTRVRTTTVRELWMRSMGSSSAQACAPKGPRTREWGPTYARLTCDKPPTWEGAGSPLHAVSCTYLCKRIFIYLDTMSPPISMVRLDRLSDFAHELSEALRLPRTSRQILDTLSQTRKTLRVEELVERVRRSERSVRENLSLLLRRGILERRIFVTTNKKLAYLYSLRPVEDLLAAARGDLARTLSRIERVAPRLHETTG